MSGAAPPGLMAAYRLVWKRRRLLWRSFRARHDLRAVADRTGEIRTGDVLVVMVVRNEAARLNWFLKHYRGLGVGHFLIVDNDSDDGTRALLAREPDVSLWTTKASYRAARFGLDWAGWLLMRYGHGHWCAMVDADELLIYADWERRDLRDLTTFLDNEGRKAFGALMLDMYPEAALGQADTESETDPIKALGWFDTGPYRAQRQAPMNNLWVQGGARERVFFAKDPRRSPTLNKLALVRWNRRWAFVNSSHSALPWRLNMAYDGPGGVVPSGVLLHTKFLDDVVVRAQEDRVRRQHFHDPDRFRDYYGDIERHPVMWHAGAARYEGWRQLVDLGLMTRVDW